MIEGPHTNKDTPRNDKVCLLAYGQDLLAILARHIIQEHQDSLPDLTSITILVPSLQNNTQIRKLLLTEAAKHGYQALLGPDIDTLSNWVNRSTPGQLPVITEQQRQLMLVEALTDHRYLYGDASPWSLADSLLALFDELSERDIQLPEKFDNFLEQVDQAYREDNNESTIDSDELTGEARLVHTLWQAWQQQLKDSEVLDRHTSYLLKLKHSEQQASQDSTYYLAGYHQFSPAETHWLKSSLNKSRSSIWLQCSEPPSEIIEYHPHTPIQQLLSTLDMDAQTPTADNQYGQCLDIIFDESKVVLNDRATEFAHNFPNSPLSSRLSLFEAKSAEHEAMAIDLQTRQWLIEGKKNIGVVTENRRLARRVRALLERSNIELQDAAGWALSTTSAAATLERWLETVEEDFAYLPLLDTLKSPFFFPEKHWPDKNREEILNLVYQFEQRIIHKENISRGLNRYLKHIQFRQNLLTEEMAEDYEHIKELLNFVSEAAQPLIAFVNNDNHKPSAMLDALFESLELLSMDETLENDDAGRKIMDEIQQMYAATLNSSLKMNWTEFRGWLGRTLEHYNFQPNIQSGHVQLMSMSQNQLYRFDALIIAGAEREYLPGKTTSSPFFNDGVRKALGLSSHVEELSHRFYQFRRLLESSDNLLITRRTEHEDELVVCSPWVERIKAFHIIAYDDDLVSSTLTKLAGHPDTLVTDRTEDLPNSISSHPEVSITEELLPKHISASAYQQLINCPYQFFAARCLKLEPPETIKEMLEKADYGERVHLCLQAFHSGVSNLPGPFDKPLSKDHREEAIQFLLSIAENVFAKDLEDNFLHRAWLKQWQALIPAYIDWQIKQQQSWKVDSTELKLETKLEGLDIPLRGRIDRIDTSTNKEDSTIDILDYKTGQVAKDSDVMSGESIQLPFYVLLASQELQKSVSRVEYISINDNKVRSKSALEGEILDELAHQAGSRLVSTLNEIKQGTPMKAWGDPVTCSRCQMSGVCRLESWSDSDSS